MQISILTARPQTWNNHYLNKASQGALIFYSFMSENEAISCISRLSVGQFIVRAEPEAMISYFPLTAEEYDCMVDKDWQEFV